MSKETKPEFKVGDEVLVSLGGATATGIVLPAEFPPGHTSWVMVKLYESLWHYEVGYNFPALEKELTPLTDLGIALFGKEKK